MRTPNQPSHYFRVERQAAALRLSVVTTPPPLLPFAEETLGSGEARPKRTSPPPSSLRLSPPPAPEPCVSAAAPALTLPPHQVLVARPRAALKGDTYMTVRAYAACAVHVQHMHMHMYMYSASPARVPRVCRVLLLHISSY